jgi:hypothetical protein
VRRKNPGSTYSYVAIFPRQSVGSAQSAPPTISRGYNPVALNAQATGPLRPHSGFGAGLCLSVSAGRTSMDLADLFFVVLEFELRPHAC